MFWRRIRARRDQLLAGAAVDRSARLLGSRLAVGRVRRLRRRVGGGSALDACGGLDGRQGQHDGFAGAQVWIDLGDVKNLAEVSVNGRSLGTVWHAPYRVNITSALKPGANELAVKVTNAWVNRLIGDEQPGATRITFADVKPYSAKSPLLPSGLLGPVRVYAITK